MVCDPDRPEAEEEVVVVLPLSRGGCTRTAPRGRALRSALAGPAQLSGALEELPLTSAIECMDGLGLVGLAWLGLPWLDSFRLVVSAACLSGSQQELDGMFRVCDRGLPLTVGGGSVGDRFGQSSKAGVLLRFGCARAS